MRIPITSSLALQLRPTRSKPKSRKQFSPLPLAGERPGEGAPFRSLQASASLVSSCCPAPSGAGTANPTNGHIRRASAAAHLP
jgi:hypothetical protein